MGNGHLSKWARHWCAGLAALAVLAIAGVAAAQVTVSVVDDTGAPITHGFRWLLEEDNTYGIKKAGRDGPWAGQAVPGAPSLPGTPSPNAAWDFTPGAANPTHTLSVNIHKSHTPTVCAGDTQPLNADAMNPGDPVLGPSSVEINGTSCPGSPGHPGYDPQKSYMLTVLPWHTSPAGTPPALQTGYGIGGRNIAPGETNVTVVVHPFTHPTAQITVVVFEDNQPINGAIDQPAEHGLGGFTLALSDMAGRVMQDAFAYPVGTTYKYQCATLDGRPAACSDACTPNPPEAGSLSTCPDSAALSPEVQPVFPRDAETGLPLVAFLGDGIVRTCPGPRGASGTEGYTAYQLANCVDPYTLTPLLAGEAVIRYLPMNKYAIEPIVPPAGVDCGATRPGGPGVVDCSDMLLTATLEGTRQNDAWVRGGEPRYNVAFGQLSFEVFFGFVHPMNALSTLPGPKTGTISGQVVQAHDQHPPLSPGLSPGLPVPQVYVGLNNLSGNDEQVYTASADPATGQFSIDAVPPGTYQLAVWDQPINAIIDYRTITLGTGPGQSMNASLGQVAVYGWFARLAGHVFDDPNQDGFPQAGVPVDPTRLIGIPNVPVNLHFTDGSMFQSTATGPDGAYSFDQYFPWWRFLVVEVDSSRNKPTGLTSIVDNGGPLPSNKYGDFGINPQRQAGANFRTEPGRVVTEALNLYQDMTAYIAFGKTAFANGENGGVRGMVNYATTRTEEDPRTSAIDGWEPGIPNVPVTLHKARRDCTAPGADPVSDCWVVDDASDPRFPLTTLSDSWNDNPPSGCVSDPYGGGPNLWPNPEPVNGFSTPSCAETFKNWDQTRPGVFDGAYAFDTMPDGSPIPPGNYIVEVSPPPGYEVLKWGDRNIEFGDPKVPFLVQPPACVGEAYDVPQFHTLFPDQQVGTDTAALGGDWYAGMQAALCDRKVVALNPGATGAVNFNLFTMVPKSARIWGTVWNDLMLEFNPDSPNASGNLGASYMPVAIKDWKGMEVARFYTDQWGHFDGLVPTSYDIAPPIPLGLTLNVYHVAPNDPGPVLDTRPGSPTAGQSITDPWYNPAYSHNVVRENWEFYAGRTTFIDSVVMPVAAFVGNRAPLNCAYTDKTPELRDVSDVVVAPGQTITITSVGQVQVPNPSYDPSNVQSPTHVLWDHGFGPYCAGPSATCKSASTVTVGGTPLSVGAASWAADGGTITATIPAGGAQGQLVVTRGDSGLSTTVGVTLHGAGAPVMTVTPPPSSCVGLACARIQPAIDMAVPGTLIVLEPGTYQEQVNLWKPVTLQGRGAAVTRIDGAAALANLPLADQAFTQLQSLIADGSITVVPGQASDFTLQQGSGILVAGCDDTAPGGCPQGNSFRSIQAQIDGLTITGASEAGGGVLLNGYTGFTDANGVARGVKITNDEIFANEGSIGGGIRIGESLVADNFNAGPVIDHNRIAQNGARFSGGGGIAVYAGSHQYRITNNLICGNFTNLYGGGIGHFGLSDGGLIQGNAIVSNESFDEGGGVHVGGENAAGASGLTPGAGSVVIDQNLIQGNKAGDDGGGIRTRRVNGQDVFNNPADPEAWFRIDVFNNIVVNNSSADHGGGLSFDDTVRLAVAGNTVARNDSTATGSDAFGGPCTEDSPLGQRCPSAEAIGGLVTSVPQVAGIASFAHSAPLLAALTGPGSYCAANPTDPQCAPFPNPDLLGNIVWQNRSFFWDASANNGLGALLLASSVSASGPALPGGYWDLAVYAPAGTLSPTYSILTNGIGATPSATNLIGADPLFLGSCLAPYSPPQPGPSVGSCFNVYQVTSSGTALGNFVIATFTPNGVQGDYHINPSSSPAIGQVPSLVYDLQSHDYDGETRVTPTDMGADQAGPVLALSRSSIAFGAVTKGTSSTAQQVIVTNRTGAAVSFATSKTGSNTGMFSVSGPGSVGARASVTLDVVFKPSGTTGPKSATLNIDPAGSATPAMPVALQGTCK